jgi:UPF0716 protein FxsA
LGRLIFLGFLAVPLIEIALFIVVGQAIGLGPTLLLVLLSAVAGVLIIRWQGIALLRTIQATMGRGLLPGQTLADTMMIWLGGALLIVPGFFTDFIGLVLLLGPARRLVYGLLQHRMRSAGPSPTGNSSEQRDPASLKDQRTIDLDDEHFRPR